MDIQSYNYLENYLDELQGSGRVSFAWQDVIQRFPQQSLNSLKLSLHRQVKKGKIVSFYKGFYLMIPPEYQKRKILPLDQFVDQLFKFLDRDYYVGLLTAASYYGAAHHQVMESFVYIKKPPMRRSEAEGLRVNYLVKSSFPETGIIKRKTVNGYINISSPELTAVDLVSYYKQAGGINRVAEVLFELAEKMDAGAMKEILCDSVPVAVLQRLGFLLDEIVGRSDLAEPVNEYLSGKNIFAVRLINDMGGALHKINSKWKIIENYEIELEIV